jgi:hypothetical protein
VSIPVSIASIVSTGQGLPHGGLIGPLVALEHCLGLLPTSQIAEVPERDVLQIGCELPPQTMPPSARLLLQTRQLLGPLPPVPEEMPTARK